MRDQRAARQMNCDKRTGASALNSKAGPCQIQLVGYPRSYIILVVSCHQLYVIRATNDLGIRLQVSEIRVHTGGGTGTPSLRPTADIAGALKRLPGALKKDAMLRIQNLRFPR